MKLKYLLEEFEAFVDKKSVYKNPTKTELLTIIKEKNKDRIYKDYGIRFICFYKEKNSYFFDDNVLHYEVCRDLKLPYDNKLGFFGIGTLDLETKKLKHVINNFVLKRNFIEMLKKQDWGFAQKYFEKPILEIIESGEEKL